MPRKQDEVEQDFSFLNHRLCPPKCATDLLFFFSIIFLDVL